MMRIANDNFKRLFVGSMSWARPASAKAGLPRRSATKPCGSAEIVTTFPIWVANHYGLKVLPVRFVRPWPVAIITLKNRTSSPVVKRFIECARDVTKLRMLNRPAPD